MLDIRISPTATPNPHFLEQPRARNQTNLAWLQRALKSKGKKAGEGPMLLLLGGADPISFRLRVAQSHARHDLTPSSWSHVVLVEPGTGDAASARAWELSLDPAGGFGYPPKTNGVQRANLRHYDDARRFPNIGLIHVPIELEPVREALHQFMHQRAVVDAVDLVTRWLPYVWGAGRAGNPLLDGQGLPSAVMVETVMGAAGFELTPGIASASSCPEALWQAARWWHEYHAREDGTPLMGAYLTDHVLCEAPG
ncbi:hypothetical protein [Stigmatella aurantiaca]|uniref:Conserved uncharacterized protein n=2 Tax=Stigmatella aurantiaca (strain DW4/3-1) TaxID=378806 RepID=E3FSV3_STIAD|nr:hypothetical protein [Stigmatella aurantiaca]ADO74577.1 conserved uncharacterized protein [Stigmatella aurantiaca DW4/3-1]